MIGILALKHIAIHAATSTCLLKGGCPFYEQWKLPKLLILMESCCFIFHEKF
jgi:hypothetical protein